MMLIRSVVEAGEPFFGSRVVEPMPLIRTHLANHIRASSREEWLHLQARHMTAPDRNRHHANSALDAGAPSTHDPLRSCTECSGCSTAQARQPRIYHSTTRWSKSDRPGAGLWLGDDLRLRGRRLGLEPVSEGGGVAHVNGTSALDDMRQQASVGHRQQPPQRRLMSARNRFPDQVRHGQAGLFEAGDKPPTDITVRQCRIKD
jgi:hypothetical protein